jgi:hypothetical protein
MYWSSQWETILFLLFLVSRTGRKFGVILGIYQKNHYDRRMVEYQRLKSKPCRDCKKKFHPVCMDWDHRPRTKKLADVSRLVIARCSWKRVLAEIRKCDLVCANCHRLRTFRREQY